MTLHRRGLLTGLIGLVAAPAIVRASSLMPVRSFKVSDYLTDECSWSNLPGPETDLNEYALEQMMIAVRQTMNDVPRLYADSVFKLGTVPDGVALVSMCHPRA